jgi:hypothetical protein
MFCPSLAFGDGGHFGKSRPVVQQCIMEIRCFGIAEETGL